SRVKEIGVRKVLGASVAGITALLSKDFVRLIVISFILASPLAYWAMSKWLMYYTYRVNITWWVFASAGILSVLIALMTVSYQSIRAAIANPAKSLRTE
ncbi:MAG TPA: FtsX-like permease family protein, partial [Puia sp.]|nr:FtsX-like permease family protein [Puia sp.]